MQRGELNGAASIEWYHARRPSAVVRQLKAEKALGASRIQAAARRRQLQGRLMVDKAAGAPR